MNTKEKLEQLHQQIKDAKKAATQTAKQLIKEGFAELFEKYDELETVSWRAWTGYFCDGDPCRFRSHHDEPSINDVGYYDLDYDDDKNEFPEMENAVMEFLGNFSDDDMLAMFGDHVEVTVTRDGVEVEEYTDHD